MRTGGADAQAAAGERLDRVVGEARDVDQPLGRLDAELHQVDEVRAAAEVGRAAGARARGGVRVGRALVGEGLHGATSAIAATMFGYAPQRQRLPLMRSRISAASSVTPSASASASMPTAEQSWPGVQ